MKTFLSTFLIITVAVNLSYAQNDSLLVSTSSTFFTPGSSSTLGQILMSTNPGNRTLQILPQRTVDGHVLDGYVFDVAYTNSAAANGFLFRSGSNNRLIINESGDVGIGTTSPLRKLDVDGSIELSGSIYGKTTDHTYYTVANGGSFNHEFYTRTNTGASSERFRIGGGALIDDVLVLNSNFDVNSGQLYVQQSNGSVGIGTTTPSSSYLLDVNGALGISESLQINPTLEYIPMQWIPSQSAVAFSDGYIEFFEYLDVMHFTIGANMIRRGAGTKTIIKDGDAREIALTTSGSFVYRTLLDKTAGDVVSASEFDEHFTITRTGEVGIGNPSPGNKLEVNGTIRSKEVIVEATSWPDYVFAPEYNLRTLDEIEAHIKEKGHLPEVPSAEEVEEEGQHLGEMQQLLLKKIEEMTLHLIDLKKENEALKQRVEKLEKDNEEN